jgi:hypothetical protein
MMVLVIPPTQHKTPIIFQNPKLIAQWRLPLDGSRSNSLVGDGEPAAISAPDDTTAPDASNTAQNTINLLSEPQANCTMEAPVDSSSSNSLVGDGEPAAIVTVSYMLNGKKYN